jgi:dTDP-4-dehydrorhamnose reductase
MIRLFRKLDTVKVVDDQCGNPTYTHDLAEALLIIIHHDSTVYGTYHFSNDGNTSWYGFAKEIYQGCIRYGYPIKQVHIVPIKTDEYPAKAVRPRNSVLSKEKFKNTFTTTIQRWETALDNFLREIAERNGDE